MTQKIQFKKVDRSQKTTVKPMDIAATIEKVKEYMLYEKRLSVYNTRQAVAALKKIINTYGATIPDKELGYRIEKDLTEKGRKPRTIRNNLAVIELWAESQGIDLKFKKPKIAGHRIDSLTAEEARALIDYGAETLRDDAIIKMFTFLGLRGKELINADVEDVDLVHRLFYVRSKHGTDIVSPGIKTYKERSIVIHKECAQALRQYLEYGRPDIQTPALFFSNKGKRLATRTLEDIVRDAAKRAGVRDGRVYPYLLRHTACTLMCQSNINLQFVSKQMGHSRIEQTIAYSHPTINAIKETLDKNFIF